MAALFEGDEEDIGKFAAKGAPRHFDVAIGDDGDGGGDARFGEGTAECPAAEDVPLVDFCIAFEFGELVFGGLGEFNGVDGGFHRLDFYHRCPQMNTDEHRWGYLCVLEVSGDTFNFYFGIAKVNEEAKG